MAVGGASTRGPKPWKLTEEESFSSFTSWKHNILYSLAQEPTFKPFLESGATWERLTSDNPSRGFTDSDGLTKEQKASNLDKMLGLITQWVPHYLANDITKQSTSIDSICQFIRKYYGFQQSETQFMKFSSITWEEGERPEKLYQRILAHLQDNLLRKDSKLKHNDRNPTKDEDISPTVERLAVLRWMELIHPSLPALVQRTFAYDLQRMTLKDLQPQIADALDGFLEELRHDDIKTACVFTPFKQKKPFSYKKQNSKFTSQARQKATLKLQCRVCQAENRPYIGHSISQCDYISRADKRTMIQSFKVDTDTLLEVSADISDEVDQLRVSDDE